MRVNKEGYLERVPKGCGNKRKHTHRFKGHYRNWWLVKYNCFGIGGSISFGVLGSNVSIPKDLVGKKVRFKIEVMEE